MMKLYYCGGRQMLEENSPLLIEDNFKKTLINILTLKK